MTNVETRRYDMLKRVREFGEAHRDLFPEHSPGRQALDTVAAAVTQLDTQAVSKMSAIRDGTRPKALARDALRVRLHVISRSARLMAAGDPGFDEPFQLPRQQTDQALITAGRLFLRNAEAAKGRFIDYGLPATFVAELRGVVDEFEQASNTRVAARDEHAGARASITAALSAGLAAVSRLDIVMKHQSPDPATLAVWQRDRRIDYARRARKVVTPAADPPAVPPAGRESGPPESGAAPRRVAL